MNEKKYITYLEQYHQWLIGHQEKANEELAEREVHAKEMQKYDKARLRLYGIIYATPRDKVNAKICK